MQTKFTFNNQDLVYQSKNRYVLSSQKLKNLISISSLIIFVSFFSFKFFHVFQLKTNHFFYSKNSVTPPVTKNKKDLIVPLLVNLRGKQGPQLAKVNVYLTLDSQNYFLSKGSKFEKQLLFLLSGQPISSLNNKAFQNQIQIQLNTFLTEQLIADLKIKTQMLN